VVLKVNSEGSEQVWLPATLGSGEAEAGGVDERDDGHLGTAIGQIDAAHTSVVGDLNAKVISVRDSLGSASRLDTSHHERILGRDLLLDTLLLLELGNIVLDLAEIEVELGLPVSNTGGRALNGVVDEFVHVGVAMMAGTNGQSLLNKEANSMGSDLALGVINLDSSLSDLVGEENVLREDRGHGGGALITAAPGLDVTGLRLSFANLEIGGPLTDGKDLLVLHLIVLVLGVDNSFNVVLDLGLGLFS
jgi:hypothetical protein